MLVRPRLWGAQAQVQAQRIAASRQNQLQAAAQAQAQAQLQAQAHQAHSALLQGLLAGARCARPIAWLAQTVLLSLASLCLI